jgi:hypothetical protein
VSSNAADDPEVAYFRDIERAFVERRGDPLFISNADWVFLARLWKKRVPMRVVLRGMTDAFDAHAHSFARKQKIRSLKFCEDQITAAADRHRRALQAEGPGPRARGAAIELLAERVGALCVPLEIAEAVAAARLGLQGVVESAGQDQTFNADQALAELEDRLAENAAMALGPGALYAMDKAARDLTAAYRSRMPARVYETLIGESVRRKILQRFGLPRFLLAEIE